MNNNPNTPKAPTQDHHIYLVRRGAIDTHPVIYFAGESGCLAEKFFDGFEQDFTQWMANDTDSRQPICVVCQHKIEDRLRPPEALLLVQSGIAPERPPERDFVDVCGNCAPRSDDELVKIAARNVFGETSVLHMGRGKYGIVVGRVLGGKSVFAFNDDGPSHGKTPGTMKGSAAPQHDGGTGDKPKSGTNTGTTKGATATAGTGTGKTRRRRPPEF